MCAIDAPYQGGMGRAVGGIFAAMTATLKEFFVALYLHFWDIMMFCFLAFVALWYLHTWINSLKELVDYIDMVIRAGEGHVSKESATPISQTGRRSPSSKIFGGPTYAQTMHTANNFARWSNKILSVTTPPPSPNPAENFCDSNADARSVCGS